MSEISYEEMMDPNAPACYRCGRPIVRSHMCFCVTESDEKAAQVRARIQAERKRTEEGRPWGE